MRLSLILATVALTAAWSAVANPLQREHIAADAKWVLHLDGEAFFATHLGAQIAKDQIDPKMSQIRADLKAWFDFDLDWRRITGATVYGVDFSSPENQRGVLILYTDLDVVQGIESAISKLETSGSADAGSIKRLEAGDQPLYQTKDAFVRIHPKLGLVAGKNRDKVVRASEVILGKAPNLKGQPAFTQFPAATGFFFFGAAEGFSQSPELLQQAGGSGGPQANLLKMANGLRLVISEGNNQIVGSLTLLAQNAETSQKMQQVVQGLLALGALSQTENADLQMLVNGTRVQSTDRAVTVELSLPVGKIAQKIAEKTGK